ncbi:MAG TPA: hypothetical protein VG937_00395 [Polyangiaceae bacterium]|nr:hypothetical protein [Polyangiaceae bacterium]
MARPELPFQVFGFHAILGNPPWVLYAGKGSQPINEREEAFLKEVYGRAAKTLSTHGLFAALAGRISVPGARIGLVLPTSVADAERYSDVRAAHDELCEPEKDLLDIGEGAFVGVFQPCMALVSTRRSTPSADATGAPWQLSKSGMPTTVRDLLAQLDARPKLPAALFGERGYRSSAEDKGKFTKAAAPVGRHTTPLYEGTSVREFELLAPTAFADAAELPETVRVDKWNTVDVFIRQTAKYPIASRSARQAFRNSVLAGFACAPYTAGFLLAYLNSTPIRWYHFHGQRDAQQGMPQVKVGHLRAIPAPADSAVEALSKLGERLGQSNRGIGDAERSELDQVVATALGIGEAGLEMVLAWGRANPPPTARTAPSPKPGIVSARAGSVEPADESPDEAETASGGQR